MTDDLPSHESGSTISKAFRTLPLFDDPFLQIQAMNLEVVDAFLMEQEAGLLDEYIAEERTPLETATFVSALSQMWMFGLYELLRTWRQRARDVRRWAKEFRETPPAEEEARLAAQRREVEERSVGPDGSGDLYWPPYETAARDPKLAETLRRAVAKTERLFRRIEALRMSLAKHEMPGIKGSFAMAPGYARIDLASGSLYWQVVLSGDEIDIVSRRGIADDCRGLVASDTASILPEAIQEKLRQFPDFSYGVKRIAVALDDGTTYKGVYVAWVTDVLAVEGQRGVPFDPSRVVDASADPIPKAKGA